MHKALSTPEEVDLTYEECTTVQRGAIAQGTMRQVREAMGLRSGASVP